MRMLTWGAGAVCVFMRTNIIDISNGDARNVQQRHRDITDIPAALCPQSCPDGSPQHSAPTNGMFPFGEDQPISVGAVAGGGGISPLPVFIIELLALLWAWVLDEATLPARLRKRTFGTTGGKASVSVGCVRCGYKRRVNPSMSFTMWCESHYDETTKGGQGSTTTAIRRRFVFFAPSVSQTCFFFLS